MSYYNGYASEQLVDSYMDATVASSALSGMVLGMLFFSLVIGLIYIISYAKVFKKAGKPWWASIVPIYNNIVMLQIAKLPIWYIILLFIPIAQIYVIFKVNIEISKKFGKSTGFGVGMTLIPIIFIPLLAFSDNVYEGDENISTTVSNVQSDFENSDVVVSNQKIETSVNSIPVAPVNVEENSISNEVQLESHENGIVTEPVVNDESQINVIPTEMNNVQPEQVMAAPVDAAPVEMNAFNMSAPTEMNNVQPEQVMAAPVDVASVEITPVETNSNEGIKKCKNCGNDLPEIVSICPSCGTDNE